MHDVGAHVDDELDRVLSAFGLADELEAASCESAWASATRISCSSSTSTTVIGPLALGAGCAARSRSGVIRLAPPRAESTHLRAVAT